MTHDEIRRTVVENVAEATQVEVAECDPEARFFVELGGDSLDILDLGFRLNKAFGREIGLSQALTTNGLELDDDKRLTVESYRDFAKRAPYLGLAPLPNGTTPPTLQDLVTVDAIVRLVEHRLAASG